MPAVTAGRTAVTLYQAFERPGWMYCHTTGHNCVIGVRTHRARVHDVIEVVEDGRSHL